MTAQKKVRLIGNTCIKQYIQKKALKDIEKIKQSSINSKAKSLIEVIRNNPYMIPPPYEKLLGELERFIFQKVECPTQINISSI